MAFIVDLWTGGGIVRALHGLHARLLDAPSRPPEGPHEPAPSGVIAEAVAITREAERGTP